MANNFTTSLDGGLFFSTGGDLDQGQNSKTFRGQTWTEDETLALLQLFRDEGFQQELEGVTRNKHIFQKLATKLINMGFNRDGEQCRTKLKNLKLQFNAVQQGYKDKVNIPRSLHRYWDSLEELWGPAGGPGGLGSRPTGASQPTPAGLFRAEVPELGNDSSSLWRDEEEEEASDVGENPYDDLNPRSKRRRRSEPIDNDDDIIKVKVEPSDSTADSVMCSTPHDSVCRQQEALQDGRRVKQRVSTATAVRPLTVAVERPEMCIDRIMNRFMDRQRDSESRFLQFELRLAEVASQRRREEREFELRVQEMWSRALFQQQPVPTTSAETIPPEKL